MGDVTEMKSRKTVPIESAAPNGETPDTRDAMGRHIGTRKTEVRLGREVQARIGQQLRAMYDQVVKEGVPPHIAELLRRLAEQDDGLA
jgi:aromatic ring-cleaving dioxygenase